MVRSEIGETFNHKSFVPFSNKIDQTLMEAKDAGVLNDLSAKADVAHREYEKFQNELNAAVAKAKSEEQGTQPTTSSTTSENGSTASSVAPTTAPTAEGKVKNFVDVHPTDLRLKQIWNINDTKDIDSYLKELKQQLADRLNDDGVDGIDFHL